ncbi:MAG: hypothetical protein AMJ65_05740 [Phycisphaerae bacterium SG8_4]|nr:MAG: hypothetical protein AMJ65_05740 [Phycisphaerae bacterium SG8_4]
MYGKDMAVVFPIIEDFAGRFSVKILFWGRYSRFLLSECSLVRLRHANCTQISLVLVSMLRYMHGRPGRPAQSCRCVFQFRKEPTVFV